MKFCTLRGSRTNETESIQRRLNNRDLERGPRRRQHACGVRGPQRQRRHLLRVKAQVWRDGCERGAAFAGVVENARLKRIIADLSVQNHILKQVNSKMVNPSAKRRAAPRSMENGAGSKSAACRELGLARSGLYRQAKSSVEGRRHPQGGAGTQRQASSLRLSALVSMWRCMRRGPSGPWMSSLSWKRLLPATEHQSICAATTDRSSLPTQSGTG